MMLICGALTVLGALGGLELELSLGHGFATVRRSAMELVWYKD